MSFVSISGEHLLIETSRMMSITNKLRGGNMAGVLSIIGGFLLHLTLGSLYCFGNMNTYMTSYLRTHVPGQEHKLYSDAIWIPTLATLGQGTFMTFAGHLEERTNQKPASQMKRCDWSVAHSVATPALLCHKEPAQGTQSPLLGEFLAFHWFFMAEGWHGKTLL